jgi:flagellar motor switch protein FliN/FliY
MSTADAQPLAPASRADEAGAGHPSAPGVEGPGGLEAQRGRRSPAGAPGEDRLSLLKNVPVEISVEIGRAKLRLSEVYELAVGQVIELDKPVGAPVDIVANEEVVIARGEVVEVDDEYGVRVTEVVEEGA